MPFWSRNLHAQVRDALRRHVCTVATGHFHAIVKCDGCDFKMDTMDSLGARRSSDQIIFDHIAEMVSEACASVVELYEEDASRKWKTLMSLGETDAEAV